LKETIAEETIFIKENMPKGGLFENEE